MGKKTKFQSLYSSESDNDIDNNNDDDIELDPKEIELVKQQLQSQSQQDSNDDDQELQQSDNDDNNDNNNNNATATTTKRSMFDSRPAINNLSGLDDAYNSIQESLPSQVRNNFVELLTITSTSAISDILRTQADIHDDLKRESLFYNLALQGSIAGLYKLDEYNIPYIRPADYYVEMLKPDQHMNKIKNRLLDEKKRIENVNKRKQYTEEKKFNKAIQNEKLKERSQSKKRAKMLKQQYSNNNNNDSRTHNELKVERSKLPMINDILQSKQQQHDDNNKPNNNKQQLPTKSKKRQHKDEKYGYGGKKRYLKQNDSKSSSDMSDYNKLNRSNHNNKYNKKHSNKGSNRPGKSKRQKMR